jgi:hypothetical protein
VVEPRGGHLAHLSSRSPVTMARLPGFSWHRLREPEIEQPGLAPFGEETRPWINRPSLWIRRIGCLLSSRSSQRAPLPLVSSASDTMLYVNFRACATPKQHCTPEMGSGDWSVGAPTAYCAGSEVLAADEAAHTPCRLQEEREPLGDSICTSILPDRGAPAFANVGNIEYGTGDCPGVVAGKGDCEM